MTFVSMTQSLYASELLAFLDADCRAPSTWLERVEAEFLRRRRPVAVGFVPPLAALPHLHVGGAGTRRWDGSASCGCTSATLRPRSSRQPGRETSPTRTSGTEMSDRNPYLLCDFHMHTTWSDGALTPAGPGRPLRTNRRLRRYRLHRPHSPREGLAGARRTAGDARPAHLLRHREDVSRVPGGDSRGGGAQVAGIRAAGDSRRPRSRRTTRGPARTPTSSRSASSGSSAPTSLRRTSCGRSGTRGRR